MENIPLPRILIIDDDSLSRKSMKRILREYDVIEAEDGFKALEIISQNPPDAVLIDQRMPKMDGLTTLKKIKELCPELSCVMVTADADVDIVIQALKSGAIDFLVKPYDVYIFKHTINVALKQTFLLEEQRHVEEERKKTEQELAKYHDHLESLVEERTVETLKAKKAAEEASKAKSEFLMHISQELNVPVREILNAVTSGLQQMTQEDKERLLESFAGIRACGNRLLKALNDLLDLSKLESGRVEYHFRKHDISDIAARAIDKLQELSAEKTCAVRLQGAQEKHSVFVDEEQMIRVLQDLLSNAMKFSVGESSIDVRIFPDEGQVHLEISDYGIGIPLEELEKIFRLFAQSSWTKHEFHGAGLGLAIVKKIVEDHKGKIWAENNADRGATFHILLPWDGTQEITEKIPESHFNN